MYLIKELTPELKEEIQNKYDEIGNIKKVAKIYRISYERLRKFIVFKNKNTIKVNRKRDTLSYRKQVKNQMVYYKGGKCEICGYNKCIEALEFHHLNPNEKDFNISGGTKSFKKLKPEIDKCILVCSNCHREIHAGLINILNWDISAQSYTLSKP